jgi:hypothetical protein
VTNAARLGGGIFSADGTYGSSVMKCLANKDRSTMVALAGAPAAAICS